MEALWCTRPWADAGVLREIRMDSRAKTKRTGSLGEAGHAGEPAAPRGAAVGRARHQRSSRDHGRSSNPHAPRLRPPPIALVRYGPARVAAATRCSSAAARARCSSAAARTTSAGQPREAAGRIPAQMPLAHRVLCGGFKDPSGRLWSMLTRVRGLLKVMENHATRPRPRRCIACCYLHSVGTGTQVCVSKRVGRRGADEYVNELRRRSLPAASRALGLCERAASATACCCPCAGDGGDASCCAGARGCCSLRARGRRLRTTPSASEPAPLTLNESEGELSFSRSAHARLSCGRGARARVARLGRLAPPS